MVPAITFKLTGDRELDGRFQELPRRLQKKVLREALRPAAKLVHQQAQQNVPVRTGRARGSLKVRAGRRSRKFPDRVSLSVITAAGWFKGPAFYFAFSELGFKLGSRKTYPTRAGPRHRLGLRLVAQRRQVPGKRWLRSALAASSSQARQLAIEKIRQGILREAQTLGRPS